MEQAINFYVIITLACIIFLIADWGYYNLLGKYFSFKTYMYEEHNLLHCVTLILISIWIITSVCYLSGIIFYYTGLLEI